MGIFSFYLAVVKGKKTNLRDVEGDERKKTMGLKE
jgi:hypothetical protein